MADAPMPQRPRAHVLNGQTVNEFQRVALQHGWDFTPNPGDDYGVDGSLEVFTDGVATGIAIPCQLKGTDSEVESQIHRVTLKTSTYHYLRAQGLALLVRFHAPSGRLWVRWLHDFDPYPRVLDPTAITISIPVSDDLHLWTDETPDRLGAEIARFRAVTSPMLAIPLALGLTIDRRVPGLEPRVRASLAAVPDLVTFDETPVVQAGVTPAELSASAGVASFNLRHEIDLSNADQVASDVAVVVACLLTRIGHANPAIRFLDHFAARSSVLGSSEVTMTLAAAYLREHQMVHLAELALSLLGYDHDEDEPSPVAMIQSAVGMQSHALSLLDRQRWARSFEVPRAMVEDADGATAYNAGQALFDIGEFEEALQYYDIAVERDPTYETSDYFVQQRAGLKFECGRYDESVEEYERLLTLREDASDRALLADALMHSGRYEDALAEFQSYEATVAIAQPHWILKRMLCELITVELSIPAQSRNSEAAQELLTASVEAQVDSPPSDSGESMREVLHLDALNLAAWKNLGLASLDKLDFALRAIIVAAATQGDYADVGRCFCLWHDVGAPTNAHEFLSPGLTLALSASNGEFEGVLEENAGHMSLTSAELLELAVDIAGPIPENPSPSYKMRFRDPDAPGGYHELDVPTGR